jgi:ribosomal protein S12 methylthiotransferase accessory factor
VATTPLWQDLCAATSAPSYRFGTQRSTTPVETLKRIKPLLPRAGITRLADITGLDWIGLPVYQAIRPNSRNISVSQGKGLTRAQAKVSALMESLESFHAECIQQQGVLATVGEMCRQIAYDPCALPVVRAPSPSLEADMEYDAYAPPLGEPSLLNDNTCVEWVSATDLTTGQATWLPRELCELDFCVQEQLCAPRFRATSNGLASGNSLAEAVVHGLCEAIERDSLWRLQTVSVEACIDPRSVGARLPELLLERFERVGMSSRIVNATGPTGVPCFVAYMWHAESPGRYFGAGCHPSAITALLRALTEAAQSRLGHIAGSRDDLFRRSYLGGSEWRAAPREQRVIEFHEVSSLKMASWQSAVCELAQRIKVLTGMAPLAVDLQRVEFGLPVTMVVAPGLRLVPPSRR